MRLGAHESVAGGLHNAFANGAEDGCEVLQVWVRSSRQWRSAPITDEMVALWRERRAETGIPAEAAHASYLINLASTKPEVVERSAAALREELVRCELLGIPHVVLHPGAHLGAGDAAGIRQVAEQIDRLFESATEAPTVRLALENTAGQGTTLGWRFEHLRDLIGAVDQQDRVVVCFDTCHAFAAGYDLRDEESYARTLEAFDDVVGLDKLALFHLNDSKTPLASRVDRHAIIGRGGLGALPFRLLVNDSRFQDRAGILETPSLPDGERSYGYCLELLKGFRGRA